MSINDNEVLLGETESLCPVCLKRLSARRIGIGKNVYLEKTCSEHGRTRVVIWRGKPSYQSWSVTAKIPSYPLACETEVKLGCPYDCGLCSEHRQRSCCVLLEVTQRCNLRCPVCFAEAGGVHADPDIGAIEGWYRKLLASGGPYNIQLSGGEPTVRDDLPEIIALGRSLGFSFIQLNTNGIRLATEPKYARILKQAGLSCVFLQFDGMNDVIYEKLRGKALLDTKMTAITRCVEQQLGVILVPTLMPGVNTGDIGNILQFAIANMPTVRGVHFQPISYFGRYPKEPAESDRITIPEVIYEIECQTGGMIKSSSLRPPGGENAYCSFHGNFFLMANGELKDCMQDTQTGCCKTQVAADAAQKAQSFVARRWAVSESSRAANTDKNIGKIDCDINVESLDEFLDRVNRYSFCVSGMAFQDVWNIDLERLKDCFIHVVSPDNRIIPFCAYNLTNVEGVPLYRFQGTANNMNCYD